MLTAMSWQVWLPEVPETILGQLQFFLAGFLLADFYLCEWKEAPTGHWSWDLVSIVLWPFVFLFSSRVGQWVFPFAVLALYCAAFRGRLFRRVFRHPWITTIGGMCYTIYLFHQLAILNAGHIVDRFHVGNNPHLYFVTEALLILPFVGMVSVVYFVLVERPCMDPKWPVKAWGRIVGGMRTLGLSDRTPCAKSIECRRAAGD
jgi:peptidoglycan/LPS O-acetylase OafA/YrhL